MWFLLLIFLLYAIYKFIQANKQKEMEEQQKAEEEKRLLRLLQEENKKKQEQDKQHLELCERCKQTGLYNEVLCFCLNFCKSHIEEIENKYLPSGKIDCLYITVLPTKITIHFYQDTISNFYACQYLPGYGESWFYDTRIMELMSAYDFNELGFANITDEEKNAFKSALAEGLKSNLSTYPITVENDERPKIIQENGIIITFNSCYKKVSSLL